MIEVAGSNDMELWSRERKEGKVRV